MSISLNCNFFSEKFSYKFSIIMEETVKERLKTFIKSQNLSINKFEKKIGLSTGYVNNIRVSLQPDKVKRIVHSFPELNAGWLLTGEGEMLKTHRNGVIEITPEVIHEGDYSGTLVYDIDAVCGTDTRNIEFTEDRIIGSVKLPEIKHSSHIINATGDSMEPVIRNGDRIAIREISSWDMIVYGQIYMVLTDEYRLLKYLRRHKTDPENMIILRSANPDYDDIDLKRSKIRNLFIVENVIAVKNIL